MATFTIDAWVVGGRVKHHRLHDHYGAESTQYVAIETDIGPFYQGTPVHYVLQEILSRITALESYNHSVGSFTLDAFFPDYFNADAVIYYPAYGHGSFTLNCWKCKGGTFTVNCTIRGQVSFTMDSVLV